MVGTGVGARLGILIKGGLALETAHAVDTVVFDKTGTLTTGKLCVASVMMVAGADEARMISLLASAELNSEHPIARAIVTHARNCGDDVAIKLVEPESYTAVAGRGLKAEVRFEAGVTTVIAGNRSWMEMNGVAASAALDEEMKNAEKRGCTAFMVAESCSALGAKDGGFRLMGAIAVSDTIKDEALGTIEAIRRLGARVVMLTGDNSRTANHVGDILGFS